MILWKALSLKILCKACDIGHVVCSNWLMVAGNVCDCERTRDSNVKLECVFNKRVMLQALTARQQPKQLLEQLLHDVAPATANHKMTSLMASLQLKPVIIVANKSDAAGLQQSAQPANSLQVPISATPLLDTEGHSHKTRLQDAAAHTDAGLERGSWVDSEGEQQRMSDGEHEVGHQSHHAADQFRPQRPHFVEQGMTNVASRLPKPGAGISPQANAVTNGNSQQPFNRVLPQSSHVGSLHPPREQDWPVRDEPKGVPTAKCEQAIMWLSCQTGKGLAAVEQRLQAEVTLIMNGPGPPQGPPLMTR